MGGAVARGLASRGKYNICVSDPSTEKLDLLKGEFPDVETTTDNIEATRKADILILVVKPWKVKDVIEEIKDEIPLQKLGECEDIARCIKWLIEDKYVTGQIIAINGGWSIT